MVILFFNKIVLIFFCALFLKSKKLNKFKEYHIYKFMGLKK